MQKRISFVVDPEGSSIVGSEQKAVGPLQKLQGHLPPTMVTRRDKYLLKREVLVSDMTTLVKYQMKTTVYVEHSFFPPLLKKLLLV